MRPIARAVRREACGGEQTIGSWIWWKQAGVVIWHKKPGGRVIYRSRAAEDWLIGLSLSQLIDRIILFLLIQSLTVVSQ